MFTAFGRAPLHTAASVVLQCREHTPFSALAKALAQTHFFAARGVPVCRILGILATVITLSGVGCFWAMFGCCITSCNGFAESLDIHLVSRGKLRRADTVQVATNICKPFTVATVEYGTIGLAMGHLNLSWAVPLLLESYADLIFSW